MKNNLEARESVLGLPRDCPPHRDSLRTAIASQMLIDLLLSGQQGHGFDLCLQRGGRGLQAAPAGGDPEQLMPLQEEKCPPKLGRGCLLVGKR